MPVRIWTLARPKSASTRHTFFFMFESAIASMRLIVVFPTPPFPLVIAMLLHGCFPPCRTAGRMSAVEQASAV